ncbi:tRNA 2-selenouridine(34) synthase MnmH [Aquibacillus koreensis]|uniref:tRNA 2-selenouridine(34) synthase MnmH n=1 Tax=Aquibacillus koreensis TaxID=279446 RepID=A0A9X4ALA3_9BACI|nr:tRNA 2-selenouridine(34) synthase MnmH [Aquibacillus koreensis]MCT2535410.1 tRNA 2-selenouridine(34) synthase MnmH [Aquibacillus koreensis]MDC3422245.1 tRNA 2-selenouridine(34) synthase MnmH [Aquibacillus koreensis]
MFKDIALEDLFCLKNEANHTLVDVRSPKEFMETTIPGSINVPIFDDEERAEVGTLYKQKGQEEAKERGLEIFSAKLPGFITTCKQLGTPLTVFCWRGGMRSKTAATVLDLMGMEVNRLSGGIRAYRQWVVDTLEKEECNPELLVLNGYTGAGKTLILHELMKRQYPVIDLEGMAQHRGSIFGQIGINPSNQKNFESQLVQKLIEYKEHPYVFIEGESKRIGKATVPDFLMNKKEKSMQIFIDMPLETRVEHILEAYHPWEYPEKFIDAFQIIKKRIHTPVAKEIEHDLRTGNYRHAVALLLTYYYDPKYNHSTSHPNAKSLHIQAETIEEAVEKIENVVGDIFPLKNKLRETLHH